MKRLHLFSCAALLAAATLFAPKTAHAWNSFGAIAVSPFTGQVGSSWGRINVFDAQRAALANCGFGGCQLAVTVQNSCASVAVGFGGRYGWAIQPNATAAALLALRNCAVQTTGCRTATSICSYRF